MAYKGDVSGTVQNQRTEGFKYNYTVEINGSTIDPELKEQVIEFKVIDVDEWADASNSDVTPENAGE